MHVNFAQYSALDMLAAVSIAEGFELSLPPNTQFTKGLFNLKH
jgi:hypothetical protein